MIIDAHAHVFSGWRGIVNGQPTSSSSYGKIYCGQEEMQVMPPSFEKSDSPIKRLLMYMEDAEIDKAVLLSNMGYGYHNDLQEQAIIDYPDKFTSVALVDITKGEKAAKQLDHMIKKEKFKGIKIETLTCFQCTEEYKLDSNCILPTWECLNDNKAIAMLHLSRDFDLDTLESLVAKYNNIHYVMSHFGAELTLRKTSKAGNWDRLKKLVANHNNMFLETSSISYHFNEEFELKKTCEVIEEAYCEVGGEKIIWGTDYPCMLLYSTYRQLRDIILIGCKNIHTEDKKKMIGENALKLFWK